MTPLALFAASARPHEKQTSFDVAGVPSDHGHAVADVVGDPIVGPLPRVREAFGRLRVLVELGQQVVGELERLIAGDELRVERVRRVEVLGRADLQHAGLSRGRRRGGRQQDREGQRGRGHEPRHPAAGMRDHRGGFLLEELTGEPLLHGSDGRADGSAGARERGTRPRLLQPTRSGGPRREIDRGHQMMKVAGSVDPASAGRSKPNASISPADEVVAVERELGHDPADHRRELVAVRRAQRDEHVRVPGHGVEDEVPVRRQRVQAGLGQERLAGHAGQARLEERRTRAQRRLVAARTSASRA